MDPESGEDAATMMMSGSGAGEGETTSHLPAASIIGGSVAIFLLLSIGCAVVVAVVVAVVLRRRKKRTGIFEIPEMNNSNEKDVLGGVTNAMYDCKHVANTQLTALCHFTIISSFVPALDDNFIGKTVSRE